MLYVIELKYDIIAIFILIGKINGKLQGTYLSNGVDKILYTDGRGIGVRSDYNGVLLLDTLLQTPVSRSEDVVKLELLFSEATLLYQCLRCVELPGVDHVQEVIQELATQTFTVKANRKKGIKAQKVSDEGNMIHIYIYFMTIEDLYHFYFLCNSGTRYA